MYFAFNFMAALENISWHCNMQSWIDHVRMKNASIALTEKCRPRSACEIGQCDLRFPSPFTESFDIL